MDSLARGGCSSCVLPGQEAAVLPCALLTSVSLAPCPPICSAQEGGEEGGGQAHHCGLSLRAA